MTYEYGMLTRDIAEQYSKDILANGFKDHYIIYIFDKIREISQRKDSSFGGMNIMYKLQNYVIYELSASYTNYENEIGNNW